MKSYQTIQVQKRRISLLYLILFFFPVIIISRLFQLQVVEYKKYVALAEKQHWAEDTIQPTRGKIFVREKNGSLYPIATNIKMNMVYVAPGISKNQQETAARLADVLKMDKDKIIDLFKTSNYYVPIKRKLSDEESAKIKDLDDKSIGLREESWRIYPENEMASQVLGYVDANGKGVYGIEEFFDDELRGVPGRYKVEKDSSGNKISVGRDISVPAKDGNDIIISLNRDVQAFVEKELEKAVEKHSAESGSVIVMDPNDGSIIAMANYPTFDPNKYSEVKDYAVFKNASISDVYEPGSIFKVITMAAGLDAKKIEPDSKYEDTGSVVLNGNTIKNSDLKTHGVQTMTQVLEQSLNTGTTYVMQKLGRDLFYKYLLKFGFGTPTGVEYFGEAGGKVYKTDEVNEHTYATMSFGQSISTTPLQMTASFGTVANGGEYLRPHLLIAKVINSKTQEVKKGEPVRVISQEASTKLTKMMVSVVKNGHGKQAGVAGYNVAGKTGTAQVPKPGGGYETGKNIGSFIGFAPAESPRFVVMAKINSPKGVSWAESTAAPVVGSVMQKLLTYFNIPPTEKNE